MKHTRAFGRSILVVDDEPRNLRLLARIIEAEGHCPRAVADGAAALAALAEEPADLVLLDVMMPGLDGHEVCRRIKGDPATRSIPVLLVTALHETGDKVRGLDAGADDFLSKPVDRAELLARIRTHLRAKDLIDELEAHRLLLVEQNRKLEELERMRWDLVHMLVHDLKNPIAAMQLSVELLRQGPAAPAAASLDNLADCSGRIALMVQNILDTARIEEGRIEIHWARFSFEDLAAATLRGFEAMASRDRKRLRLTVDPQADAGRADRGLIARVLENLVSNALNLSDEGVEVEVRVERAPEGGSLVTVADRGPGVPENLRGAVFDKFQSFANRRSGGFGNHGLGLTFCKLAVEAHGGRIWVEPREGGGSLFRFRLPGVSSEATTAVLGPAAHGAGIA